MKPARRATFTDYRTFALYVLALVLALPLWLLPFAMGRRLIRAFLRLTCASANVICPLAVR